MNTKVCYIWSQNLIKQCDRLPAVPLRASMVNSLVTAYDLQNHMKIIQSKPALYEDLREFHSELYIDHLMTIKEVDEDYVITTQDEDCGLGYDCEPVSNMFELVTEIAGSSITAANSLVLGVADVAINWFGGWHHASRFGAEGFCYINDVVLAIEKLRKKFPRVLYIDLDVHHGNGVEDAYNISKSVYTLSFHKFEPGFYPGTGAIDNVGALVGKGYCSNVPLQSYYNDESLSFVFKRVFNEIFEYFKPNAVLIQCGADALARDPNGGANLTERGYIDCVKHVCDKQLPTLLLGGGGYNFTNAARLWTNITASILDLRLNEEIPEHDYWDKYGPEFTLNIKPCAIKDGNNRKYLEECVSKIKDNLIQYFGELECIEGNHPEKRSRTS